ncbi:sensor histidine kinase [Sporolactobacillus laevolacticus]|uniref:histidine kinase n=1 Tax=Sporolactobacillus laevolacticus DSM 442 TaxID=1395513 RepID=V6IY56_9BACL|nr:HAMP domain-containing sensor histidine kinase [Sporolactobacillus laevolacticus]EST11651.1 membrane protein [Sporolactobacillus laevolacticus DSM 442]MDN3953573.1 HAMP domain-containing sensor histidine kinase [Sporolactobacillus laevolacticus]
MQKSAMRRLRAYGLVILLLLLLNAFWVFFYMILGFALKWYGFGVSPLVLHIVSALLGIVLFGFVMTQVGKFLRPKRMTYFQTIIQAMRQMAKGNFEIKLDMPIPEEGKHRHNPFIQLADSVHYMAKELGQLERVRQEFISNVSHEIQSPLTSIKGFARALENENLSKEQHDHYLRIIQTETDRLSKLSDNLLKLTALENGRHPMHMTQYRPDRQIRSCLLALEPQWSKKNLRMNIELDPITIHADSELMNQVWMNLIHNSIKFTPEDGEIKIELKKESDGIWFRLSDTGVGIKKEDFVHLFERFYKADRSRNRKQGGNGLGLSIVKKIIDVHQGEIHVRSDYGKGTTFSIKLEESGVE